MRKGRVCGYYILEQRFERLEEAEVEKRGRCVEERLVGRVSDSDQCGRE
jgi:hypothetical protein